MSNTDDEIDELEVDVMLIVGAYMLEIYANRYCYKVPRMTSQQTGDGWLREILQGHEDRCLDMFRMSKDTFLSLLHELETKYNLRGSRHIGTAEMLGMFLYTLALGESNRSVQERFQHSGETISRYFHLVLDKVLLLATDIISPADRNFQETPLEIREDLRYWPHFKDCIGAIDGVHIPAIISKEEQVHFIGRKGIPTQNIMAACGFNMQFTFVLAGIQGTCHDASIFSRAVNDPSYNFPHPPEGKYYLVDSGYALKKGYLGPYRGERYHLPGFRTHGPSGYREIFNHAHSGLRSVIERAFGIWKKQWKILKDMHGYDFETQRDMVVATMVLHNFILRHKENNQQLLHGVCGSSFENIEFDNDDNVVGEDQEEIVPEMEMLRDNIAMSLMNQV